MLTTWVNTLYKSYFDDDVDGGNDDDDGDDDDDNEWSYPHCSPQVQTWTRKAPSCGFHIVPVPVSPFPDPAGRNVDPFRLPLFISLNLPEGAVDAYSLFKGEKEEQSRHPNLNFPSIP